MSLAPLSSSALDQRNRLEATQRLFVGKQFFEKVSVHLHLGPCRLQRGESFQQTHAMRFHQICRHDCRCSTCSIVAVHEHYSVFLVVLRRFLFVLRCFGCSVISVVLPFFFACIFCWDFSLLRLTSRSDLGDEIEGLIKKPRDALFWRVLSLQ